MTRDQAINLISTAASEDGRSDAVVIALGSHIGAVALAMETHNNPYELRRVLDRLFEQLRDRLTALCELKAVTFGVNQTPHQE